MIYFDKNISATPPIIKDNAYFISNKHNDTFQIKNNSTDSISSTITITETGTPNELTTPVLDGVGTNTSAPEPLSGDTFTWTITNGTNGTTYRKHIRSDHDSTTSSHIKPLQYNNQNPSAHKVLELNQSTLSTTLPNTEDYQYVQELYIVSRESYPIEKFATHTFTGSGTDTDFAAADSAAWNSETYKYHFMWVESFKQQKLRLGTNIITIKDNNENTASEKVKLHIATATRQKPKATGNSVPTKYAPTSYTYNNLGVDMTIQTHYYTDYQTLDTDQNGYGIARQYASPATTHKTIDDTSNFSAQIPTIMTSFQPSVTKIVPTLAARYEKYYGNLTIQEYRKLLSKDRLLLVVDKPLTKILPELYEENNELPNIFDDILSSKTHKQPQYRLKRKQVGNSKLTSLSSNFGLNH